MRTHASYTPSSKELTIWLVNKDTKSVNVTVNLNNYQGSIENERWIFTGTDPDDLNPTISKEISVIVEDNNFKLELPPYSITVVTF